MKGETILFTISNNAVNAVKTYILRGEYNNNIGTFIELVKIYPHYPFLKFIMNYLFFPLKPVLHNLDKNVCFLDIPETYNMLRISCDWCSICNGIVETTKQNIIKNPKLVKQIDFLKLKIADKYLNFVLVDRTEKIENKKIKEWCKSTFGKTNTHLLLLSSLYVKIEMIELRWCPFKRSKEFYYRNKDNRYLEPTEKMIYKVGKILSKYETITCNNCPKVVNDKWKYTKSNKQSIFQPLLDYMMEEINS